MSNDHWFKQLIHGDRPATPERPELPRTIITPDDDRAGRWITTMLRASCEEVARTGEGRRNRTLYEKAFRVFRHVHGGYLGEYDARDALAAAARSCGLDDAEILRTINSAALGARDNPAVLELDDADEEPVPDCSFDFEPESPPDGVTTGWVPEDLGPYVDGTWVEPETGILVRVDGVGLLYPAHVHWFHGESESGKSWVAQYAVASVLGHGGKALYVDHESNPGEVVQRLISMGADPEAIRSGLTYVRPNVPVRMAIDEFKQLCQYEYAIAVIDGVTEAVTLDGTSSKDNDEIAVWMKRVPKQLARWSKSAVVCIDHVAKASETRGRFAIGGQHKMAGIDGAAYLIEPVAGLGKGVRGELKMSVAKDRPGSIRAHCGEFGENRLQEAARVVVDSSAGDGRTVVTVEAPKPGGDANRELLEQISRIVEGTPGISGALVEKFATGRAEKIRDALNVLVQDEYVEREIVHSRSIKYTSLRPYRVNPTSWDEPR